MVSCLIDLFNYCSLIVVGRFCPRRRRSTAMQMQLSVCHNMCVCVCVLARRTKTPDQCVLKHGTVVVLNCLSKPIDFGFKTGSILSMESNQNVESKTKNVESKTEKCGVQNNIWSVDSQENH